MGDPPGIQGKKAIRHPARSEPLPDAFQNRRPGHPREFEEPDVIIHMNDESGAVESDRSGVTGDGLADDIGPGGDQRFEPVGPKGLDPGNQFLENLADR